MLNIKDCGIGTSVFTLNTLGINPANPVGGQNVTMSVEYTVPDGYTVQPDGGKVLYDIAVNYIPLPQTSTPLCDVIPCPLGPGVYFNESSSTWPSGLSGKFNSKIRWKDANDALLACIQISGSLSETKKRTAAATEAHKLLHPETVLSLPAPERARSSLRKM
jgi:hypothetical protein